MATTTIKSIASLGPVLANIFMRHFEEKWVLNYIGRPSIWFRYVDDTFTLFDSKNNALQFLQYLNFIAAT